jgi:uncharacterized protein
MDKQAVRIGQKFLSKARKVFRVDSLILFGSRARGDHFITSDFDFVMVSDDFGRIPFIFRASELYDYWDEDVDLEILCYTRKEFERKKGQFGIVRRAVEEGIVIRI